MLTGEKRHDVAMPSGRTLRRVARPARITRGHVVPIAVLSRPRAIFSAARYGRASLDDHSCIDRNVVMQEENPP